MTYTSFDTFYTSRELSVVIAEIDTGASVDEVPQVMGPRDQGNSSRSGRLQQFWTALRRRLAAVESGLQKSGTRGWEPGGFHLKRQRCAVAAEASGTCRRRCCPAVPPAPPPPPPPPRSSGSAIPGGGGDARGGRERVEPLGKEPELSWILKRPH